MRLEKAVLTMNDGRVITHDYIMESEKYKDILMLVVSEPDRTCIYAYKVSHIKEYRVLELRDSGDIGYYIDEDIKSVSTIIEVFERAISSRKEVK